MKITTLANATISMWLMATVRVVMGETPIKILGVSTDNTHFNSKYPGSSTIVIDYALDGATFGQEAENKDFYVLQSLGTYEDCSIALSETPPTSLEGAMEPLVSGSTTTSTTTLVNTFHWPRGENKFCLRMQLMLKRYGGKDLVWHQRDILFAVTVSFLDGESADLIYDLGGGGSSTNARIASTASSQLLVPFSDVHATPSFTATTSGTFGYGEDIPIHLTFDHPLDIFTYSVNPATAILVDGSNAPLTDEESGALITIQNSQYEDTEQVHANGLAGRLTVSLPRDVYPTESTGATIRILLPITWVIAKEETSSRGLRGLQPIVQEADKTGSSYTGPVSGVVNEVVEVNLFPLVEAEESGVVVGFAIGSIVSIFLSLGGALILV